MSHTRFTPNLGHNYCAVPESHRAGLNHVTDRRGC
jgi:hypothetical protein